MTTLDSVVIIMVKYKEDDEAKDIKMVCRTLMMMLCAGDVVNLVAKDEK